MGQVKILSCNRDGEALCASAARISTTPGNAVELFEHAADAEKNRKLIGKVLASGHKSVVEHMVMSLAFCDVSAAAEEFMIEHRLASYTVKSRRYVDFSGLGFYIPTALGGESRARFVSDMEALFAAYRALLERGVPKEDARFLLPYAFHSNFYCTLNARELVHVLEAMRAGAWALPELGELADQLEEQLAPRCPYLKLPPRAASTAQIDPPLPLDGAPRFFRPEELGRTELLQGPSAAKAVLEASRALLRPEESGETAPGQRELEQLGYTFRLTGISLSGLTHLVRHRIQSLLVPPLPRLRPGRFILPESVRADTAALEIYSAAVRDACARRAAAMEDEALRPCAVYYLLSGTLTDVITTMNGRELREFLRLRCCSRAQWEIREIAVRMLGLLRGELPEIFNGFGPSCYLLGYCPEGRMSCGRAEEMRERFAPPSDETDSVRH